MTVSFMLHIIVVLLICGILWLIAQWILAQLGLGDPWPRIVMLLLVLVIIVSVVAPLLGYGRLWPVGAP
jgi:hypothetical protein